MSKRSERQGRKKKGKPYLAIGIIGALVIGGLGYVYVSTQGGDSGGPSAYLAGTWFNSATVSAGKVDVPKQYVKDNKLVFLDLKLGSAVTDVSFQGRTLPLSDYKSGGYIPLVLIYTPSGNVVSGVRVCEPCGSFSFHLVDGKYLRCDRCGTEWDIETMKGVSGGCVNYPPPALATTVGGDVSVDVSALGLTLA